jgi:hypothetical protein
VKRVNGEALKQRIRVRTRKGSASHRGRCLWSAERPCGGLWVRKLATGTKAGQQCQVARLRVPAAALGEVCDMVSEPGARETGGDAADPAPRRQLVQWQAGGEAHREELSQRVSKRAKLHPAPLHPAREDLVELLPGVVSRTDS